MKENMKIFSRKAAALALALAASCTQVFSLVSFDDISVSPSNGLLFTVRADVCGSPSYKALFETVMNVDSPLYEPHLLTCFPEKIEALAGGKYLQIRNRYGSARLDLATKKLVWNSVSSRIPVEYHRTASISVSPDGKWSCYVRQRKNSVGQLVLRNELTLQENILVEKASFDYEKACVKWCPDSSCLLYEKDGSVYFITPDSAFKNVQLPEDYRKIGSGYISSVEWASSKALLYINGDIVYSIQKNELYTRGLYSALVGYGKIMGRLPSAFDSVHDRFFSDADGMQLIVITGENILNYYSLGLQGYDFVQIKGIYSLSGIKGSPLDYRVFWTSERKPVLWVDMLSYADGKKVSAVYSLYGKMDLLIEVARSIEPRLSPDKAHIAFTSGNAFYVYDTTSWKQCVRVQGEKIHSLSWIDSFNLATGGEETVRKWFIDFKSRKATDELLYISSPLNPFFSGENICVSVKSLDSVYMYNKKTNNWEKGSAVVPEVRRAEKNGSYRVFTGACSNSNFSNALYVRSLSRDVVTYPVYKETQVSVPAPKKIALAFDAMDNASGVARILNVLEEFNVKGTFFLNGEFIRRYPVETKQIAFSGCQCASIFYSTADLLAKNFVIDADFIKRGLARNEDEFFLATGKELSLLWHAPYYSANDMMKEASLQAGYTYVDAFSMYSDSVTFEQSARDGVPYYSFGELIDKIVLSLEDGMVIPVNAGKGEGTRKDYLYEHLDLLIASILDSGCQIVDIRELQSVK